jgi:hypothetical protein
VFSDLLELFVPNFDPWSLTVYILEVWDLDFKLELIWLLQKSQPDLLKCVTLRLIKGRLRALQSLAIKIIIVEELNWKYFVTR